MKWRKFTFETSTDSVDIMSALLSDAGIEGIEVEDHRPISEEDTRGMFIDILPDMGVDNGRAQISFYLDPADEKAEEKIAAAREVIGDAELTESETKDEDWINNWKEFFKPLTVGNILIKPTWEEIPEEDKKKILIQIDPGTAFGTGGHETTKLCILALERFIEERNRRHINTSVLDVGTGSGILGICALRLGASRVFGTDLDENAIQAVKENLFPNAIMPEEFPVVCGNIIDNPGVQFAAGMEQYDIVTANILAPVIIELQKEVWKHLKPGGIFITSGIIDTKEQEVREAIEANPHWEILDVRHLGEWVNINCRRVS